MTDPRISLMTEFAVLINNIDLNVLDYEDLNIKLFKKFGNKTVKHSELVDFLFLHFFPDKAMILPILTNIHMFLKLMSLLIDLDIVRKVSTTVNEFKGYRVRKITAVNEFKGELEKYEYQ